MIAIEVVEGVARVLAVVTQGDLDRRATGTKVEGAVGSDDPLRPNSQAFFRRTTRT